MKLTLIGTDGKEYKVIKVIDTRTGRPLQPGGLALVARDVLEEGIFTSEHIVMLHDTRFSGVADLISAHMAKHPDWLASLQTLQYNPLR